ncbi:MAG: hypothetical protein KDE51_21140 [Anaerolineales bacterium]|nr:hypothetical protein [Anaerolineales bacterium]
MDHQNLSPQLQEAMQPYLAKGYEVVTTTDRSAELLKPKVKMGWWVALLNTGGYARNRDRTAHFQVTDTGEVEITGDTLDKLEADERVDKGVKTFRIAILVIFLVLFLSCAICVVGSSLSA